MAAPDIAMATFKANAARKPSLCHTNTDTVVPSREIIRDVVGLVLQSPIVRCPPGSEEVVAHTATVDLRFVYALGGDIKTGFDNRIRGPEFLAIQLLRVRLGGTWAPWSRDALALPITSIEQTNF
jgi:hypothetical protein